MPPLDAALLRLGLVTLELLHPSLAERVTPDLELDKDEAGRVAADVDRVVAEQDQPQGHNSLLKDFKNYLILY